MLALTIVFPEGHLKQGEVKPFIEDACLMFGGSFDLLDIPEDSAGVEEPTPSRAAASQVEVEMTTLKTPDNKL